MRPAPTSSAPRLLVVDDEPGCAQPIASYFRKGGFRIDVAEEPELAAALLEFWRYDAVILDVRLTPWGAAGGLDLLRRVRERSPWAVAVVLAGHLEEEVEAEAYRRGADAVLRRPQPLADLAHVVAGLIGRREASGIEEPAAAVTRG